MDPCHLGCDNLAMRAPKFSLESGRGKRVFVARAKGPATE